MNNYVKYSDFPSISIPENNTPIQDPIKIINDIYDYSKFNSFINYGEFIKVIELDDYLEDYKFLYYGIFKYHNIIERLIDDVFNNKYNIFKYEVYKIKGYIINQINESSSEEDIALFKLCVLGVALGHLSIEKIYNNKIFIYKEYNDIELIVYGRIKSYSNSNEIYIPLDIDKNPNFISSIIELDTLIYQDPEIGTMYKLNNTKLNCLEDMAYNLVTPIKYLSDEDNSDKSIIDILSSFSKIYEELNKYYINKYYNFKG